MDPIENALFLSLRPVYAELIVLGTKTIELRRIRPRALPGTLVIIYASSPIKQIIGTCIVDEIGVASPEEIWRLHGPRIGLDWHAVATYFHGKAEGVAISVTNPVRLANPIPLLTVREHLGNSAPPQSFRYIYRNDADTLIRAGSPVCDLEPVAV